MQADVVMCDLSGSCREYTNSNPAVEARLTLQVRKSVRKSR